MCKFITNVTMYQTMMIIHEITEFPTKEHVGYPMTNMFITTLPNILDGD